MLKLTMSHLPQASRVAGAVLTLLSLSLSYPGTVSNLRAQSPSKVKASSPSGAPKEGIKVRGHWTIEIRNPDGKLVSRREFDNHFLQSGASMLGSFLQRTSKAGEWRVRLSGTGDSPCLNQANDIVDCFVYESASQNPSSSARNAFKTLTISSQGGTALTGTVTAQRNGSIFIVETAMAKCPVDTQGVCVPDGPQTIFTNTNTSASNGLGTVFDVVAGQIIQFTVVISFS